MKGNHNNNSSNSIDLALLDLRSSNLGIQTTNPLRHIVNNDTKTKDEHIPFAAIVAAAVFGNGYQGTLFSPGAAFV